MKETGRKFPTVAARRGQAIELLARGLDRDAVCRKLKVSARTLRNYLADPAVQTTLAQAQGERLEGLRRQSLDGAGEALDVLKTVMNDGETPPAARVSAASALAATAVKLAGPAIKVEVTNKDAEAAKRAEESRKMTGAMLEHGAKNDPVLWAAWSYLAEWQAEYGTSGDAMKATEKAREGQRMDERIHAQCPKPAPKLPAATGEPGAGAAPLAGESRTV
jgi:hypothetical protein